MIFKGEYFSGKEGEESINMDMDEVTVMVLEWFVLSGVFNIGDWIPWLDSLDLQGHIKKLKALRKKMDTFYDYVIDDHLAKRVVGEVDDAKKDFVDILLQIAEEEDGVEFTRDCVKALIMNMLVGASDSSATVIEWAIHEILKQPRTIEKAKAELNNVIGRWIEENDLTNLSYINAIIMETMRLHPIATMLVPHCAIKDCNVAGYNISKGTMVLVNVWSIGRNPNSWEAPQEFLPERFVGKEIEMITGIDFAVLPFGSGRRDARELVSDLRLLEPRWLICCMDLS